MTDGDLLDSAVVAKSDYAAMKGVTPSRVSQWIAEGKISGDALVGEGRSAKIDLAKADAQLAARLDLSQRLGNGIGTRIDSAPRPSATDPSAFRQAAGIDLVHEQLRLAKLEREQRANRREAEEEAERRGLFVESAAARKEMGKIAERTVRLFEGSLADFAQALAARFQIPQRDALHLLRAEFRSFRERAAAQIGAEAASEPELVDHSLEA